MLYSKHGKNVLFINTFLFLIYKSSVLVIVDFNPQGCRNYHSVY